MSNANWMSQCTNIHSLALKNICLPASHDSGTYALTDKMTPYPSPEFAQIQKICSKITSDLNSIPGIGQYIPNPAQWVVSSVVSTIKDIATATNSSISTQLADGIRCLDLRIYYDTSYEMFFIYHGLVGPSLGDVLLEIQTFLQNNAGEIVYITFGHGITSDNSAFPYQTLWNQINAFLGSNSFNPQYQGTTITNSVFDQTYTQIVASAPTSSVAVLVDGDNSTPISPCAWPSTYSPPDNSSTNAILYGLYTNTSDYDRMVSGQYSNFKNNTAGLPFALYMTMTPQPSDVGSIIAANLMGALTAAAGTFHVVAPQLLALAAGLKIYELTLDWTTLSDLSAQVVPKIPRLVGGIFDQTATNPITFIYSDFYETGSVVRLCIAINNGLFTEARYLFGFNPADSNYWFIQQLFTGGLMGAETSNGNWNNSYQPLVPYLCSDGSAYLFGINPNNNYWFIQQLSSNGQLLAETDNGTWNNCYYPIVAFTIGGQTFIFGQNPDSNYWFIQQMLPGGKMGGETDTGTWSNAYPIMLPLAIDGRAFLFGFNTRNNYFFIQEILPGGIMGAETATGTLNASSQGTAFVPVTLQGPNGTERYIFQMGADGSGDWATYQISPGGGMSSTPTVKGSFSNYYANLTSYEAAGQAYIFGFNTSNNYWFIQQVVSGGNLGPETDRDTWNNDYQTLAAYSASL